MLGDVLWCLGLGLGLAAARDLIGLVIGNGRFLGFLWDLLVFAAAAVLVCGFAAGVSASGVARWYMAAGTLAGAVGWYWAVSAVLHSAAETAVRVIAWPFRLVGSRVVRPFSLKIDRLLHKIVQKLRKKPKDEKKMLQKPSKILYN
ncbi:MAG: hypothetical protein ACI4OI_03795 [Gemmiger sp.]